VVRIPNAFAHIVLVGWVFITLAIFAKKRPARATIIAMLTAAMFLPQRVVYDFPAIPPIDKDSIAALSALVGCLIYARSTLKRARPFRGVDLFFVLAALGCLGTGMTNGDPLSYGVVQLPGITLYDGQAMALVDLLTVFLPFFLGRAMLTRGRDLQDLLRLLVLGGLVYSVLALIEIRLSPQLHNWFYGFGQHSFAQTIRSGGGYRPMVFMAHGLALAMFMCSAVIAAMVRGRIRRGSTLVTVYLFVVLLLCKSMASIVYASAAVALLLFARPKSQLRVAVFLAGVTLAYPVLRMQDWFPVEEVLSAAEVMGPARHESLAFRFDNEEVLLDKARERLLFGWGEYGRNRIYDEEEGYDTTVADGFWIITMGSRGMVGFIGIFGLLAASVFLAARAFPHIPNGRNRAMLAGLALIVAFSLVDLLPNGRFSYIPIFLSGALAGLARGLREEAVGERSYSRRRRRAGPPLTPATPPGELPTPATGTAP
jgi:hypothetical protein